MVAGDHDRSDASAFRARHRLRCFLARRIDHADETEEDEIPLYAVVECLGLARILRQRTKGDPKGAQRFASELFVECQDFSAAFRCQRPRLLAYQLVGAAGEQHVRRTFSQRE
jgi:hypothetical protein